MSRSFRDAVDAVRRDKTLYFAALLPEKHILEAFGAARGAWQGWIYTPAVTVWVFLSQCLSMDHSCRDAVSRLNAWHVSHSQSRCSAQTGAYCTARDSLPEAACRELVRQTGVAAERDAPTEWLWKGRRVCVVDGSTITMPDTAANQAEYPQPRTQAPGCGLPIARIVAVFSLSVGTVLEAAIGKYHGKQTGENSLFRTISGCLADGDILLADRYFGGWFDIALSQRRSVDVVVRKHQLRSTDFRTGRRLGSNDHCVCWPKPSRPEWMSPETYAQLPDELTLREVRVRVAQKRSRTKQLMVVTTLLDAEEHSALDIAELYRRRWQAELNLRSLKSVLQMDHLRCKTPHRVRNEFFMHLVAYNLIRRVLAQAALESGVSPWQVSFKGALQTMNAYLPMLCSGVSPNDWIRDVLQAIGAHAVGNRPDRYEPRLVKRRAKPYKLLQAPRANYKKRVA
jgi:putative transposase